MPFDLVDPTAGPVSPRHEPAPRPGALTGLTVGLLDNSKRNSARLLQYVGEVLVQEHGAAGTVLRSKPSASTSAPAEVFADLKARAHVIVAGIGD